MDQNATPPFDCGYVLRTTARHMRKSVDISTRKTLERLAEFSDNPAKQLEVFHTLTRLQAIKRSIDDFEHQHS